MDRHNSLLFMILTAVLVVATNGNSQTYTVLHNYPTGAGSYSGIVAPQVMSQGRDGNLYSTISNAGTHNDGTVYMIDTAGNVTTIYNFCSVTSCADGLNPFGGVTLGFDGNFYGTSQGGGSHAAGTVFKVTPGGTLTTLWNFANGTDDSVPLYTTALGQDGNMYGVSVGQYNGQNGAFFKVSSTGVFKTLADFAYTNGAIPNLPTQGTDGNFYGTTQGGGDPICKCGVVYKATAAGKITVLHAFKGYPSDGYRPIGVLVQGADGNFYGTTNRGGAHNQGSVFKLTPAGVYTQLYSFNFSSTYFDAQLPQAGVTAGTDGNFYGVGTAGGSKNAGAIFKITPAGSESILYNFCSVTCADGFGPATPLVLHTNGKFYGNTNGNSLDGSVSYRLDVGLKPLVNLENWTGKVSKIVEILGQGFTGTTQVSFNGIPAAFSNVSDTYMTATVPAAALTGTVTVTTFTDTMKSNRIFLVTPQINSFAPASGTVGTSVVITGLSLAQTSKVTIGGKTASFTIKSNTQLTAVVPAGAKTGTTIMVTTAGGTGSSTGKFAVVPQITGFTPTTGPVGTSVTITGNSFTGATQVSFGGVAATSFQVIKDTQIGALVPSGSVTGPIAVTTPGGTATSSTSFTVTH